MIKRSRASQSPLRLESIKKQRMQFRYDHRETLANRLKTTALILFSLLIATAAAVGSEFESVDDQLSENSPDQRSDSGTLRAWFENLDTRFGGRFKTTGTVSWHPIRHSKMHILEYRRIHHRLAFVGSTNGKQNLLRPGVFQQAT